MTILINGQPYTLKFTYRALLAIAKYLGFSKIAEGSDMIKQIGLDNVPNIISITITENLRKEKVKGSTPSADHILDALDDNPEVFGEVIEAFASAYAALFPAVEESEDESNKIATGE